MQDVMMMLVLEPNLLKFSLLKITYELLTIKHMDGLSCHSFEKEAGELFFFFFQIEGKQ